MQVNKFTVVEHVVSWPHGDRPTWEIEMYLEKREAEVIGLQLQTIDDRIERPPYLILVLDGQMSNAAVTVDAEHWPSIPAWLRELLIELAPQTFCADGLIDAPGTPGKLV